MATQRQINNALLEAPEVIYVNRVMKKVNLESDNLYESMMDQDDKETINVCGRITDICSDVVTKIKRKYGQEQ